VHRFLWIIWTVITCCAGSSRAADDANVFRQDNLVAWCIVPFDAKHRSPQERVDMLAKLGFKRYAYDWRAEHLPTFETEILALQKQQIELTAVWFPDSLNADARLILDLLKKHNLHTQLWVTTGDGSLTGAQDQAAKVQRGVDIIRPIAEEADKIGCTVALYNHGGWFGEPENQLAILGALKRKNVGIVYNLHHGHEHVPRFAQLLEQIKPHLLCLDLNGMTKDGEKLDKKILPIGQGELDLTLLKIIKDSKYTGPIAILNHTDHDAEARLLDNLEGLRWLVPQLNGEAAGAPPKPRTYSPPATRRAAASTQDYWGVEDAAERAKLPLYQTIPAATANELTPANGWPDDNAPWSRSHGGDACRRYSPLAQINRDNVKSLKVAWTYHSNDGPENLQCNPVVIDGTMYAPTSGNHVVAINAATGAEVWRFKPGGLPAKRGLTFHRTSDGIGRLIFASGNALWTLTAGDGKPVTSFGNGGRIEIIDCATAPVVYRNVLVYAGWNRDVFGVDVVTGAKLWKFNTVAQPGEPFGDTWDQAETGANCWGGMALDASRGIVYVTTGSPKPNFMGPSHRGDNLFANCVLALDAVTGKRLWHFQEIRHDIWDLDIPAPPVLVTVKRDGRDVDAVAAVTKIGNTLLLDRVTGKPLFPFRLRRAPTSTLPGEVTAPYQPDVELPEPFSDQNFTLDDVTNISSGARNSVLAQLQNASYGWFQPFTVGKPLVIRGIQGGAEWTGASFDPKTNFLYVSSNNVPWIPALYRHDRAVTEESKLPATAGRAVYAANCMPCHGPNREGQAVYPSLVGLSYRLHDADVIALLKTGRGNMPAAHLAEQQRSDLLNYLFDRDRAASHTLQPRPQRPGYRDIGYPKILDSEGYPGTQPPWGLLNCINLNTGKIVWRVPLGEYEALTRRGIPITGTENFGGPTVTAGGVVFCAGTRDLKIRAFDAATGEILWQYQLPHGGFAPPTVYAVNGKQYVVVPSTGGGKLSVPPIAEKPAPLGDAYIAFTLP
jgi:quinoprotein glucose dehydrogenase